MARAKIRDFSSREAGVFAVINSRDIVGVTARVGFFSPHEEQRLWIRVFSTDERAKEQGGCRSFEARSMGHRESKETTETFSQMRIPQRGLDQSQTRERFFFHETLKFRRVTGNYVAR